MAAHGLEERNAPTRSPTVSSSVDAPGPSLFAYLGASAEDRSCSIRQVGEQPCASLDDPCPPRSADGWRNVSAYGLPRDRERPWMAATEPHGCSSGVSRGRPYVGTFRATPATNGYLSDASTIAPDSIAERRTLTTEPTRNRHERTGTELRRHRAPPARRLHREGVPRLLDVRDPRPRAAASRRRPEARTAPHRLCDERPRPLGELEAEEGRAHRRRRARQVPPARRLGVLRGDGPYGPAVLVPLSDHRRARQLGLAGRSEVVRRDALHRGAAHEVRAGAARGARAGHGRLGAEFRRHARGAVDPAGAAAGPAAERLERHRGRHV